MKYKLQDLIDFKQLQSLQKKLNKFYSTSSAIIDCEGNILTETNWKAAVEKINYINHNFEKEDRITNQYILEHLNEANPSINYHYPNGLVKNAIPIIVKGIHYGNFFTEPFFHEPPNLDFFKTQAMKFGLNEIEYLNAVKAVPIWSTQLENYLYFVNELIEVLLGVGLKNLKEIEIGNQTKESELKYRSFFENSFDAILLASIDGQIFAANPTACKMFGRTEHELCSVGRKGIVDISDSRMQVLIREREEKGVALGELNLLRIDGSIFPAEVSMSIFKGAEENIQSIMIIRDITERKRVEEELKTSKERLTTVLNNAPITIFATDSNGIFTLSQGKGLELVGLKPEENVGVSAIDLYKTLPFRKHSGEIILGENLIKRVLAGESITVISEFRNRVFDNIISPIRDIDENITGIVGVAFDINERMNAERLLKESEEKYRKLVELSPEAIVVHQDGELVFVNSAAVDLLGANNSDELVGKPIIKFVHPDFHQIVKMRSVAGESEKVPLMEEKFIRSDGTIIDVEVTAIPFEYHGKPAVQVVIQDITNRNIAKNKLEDSYIQVQALAEHIQTIREEERLAISRDIHDDMGQILTALKIELSLIENEIVTNVNHLNSDYIITELKEMQVLIDTAIKSVRKLLRELRPEVLDTLGLLKTLRWQAEEFESKTGIKCSFNSNVSEFTLDNKRSIAIYRILQEGLTNIAKHANANLVEIRLSLENEILILAIEDNGKGFSPKILSEKRTMGIIGMRERTLILDGEFKIDSKVGKGTTILLSIPTEEINGILNLKL